MMTSKRPSALASIEQTGCPLGALKTAGRSPAPMSRPSRRETLTPWFTEAVKVIDVRVVCVPTVGSTLSHCASKRPMPGMMSSGVGRPARSSTVRRYFESVCVPPRMTPSRKRAWI